MLDSYDTSGNSPTLVPALSVRTVIELRFPSADFTEYFNFIESRPLLKAKGNNKHHIAPRAEFPELVKDKANLIHLSYQDHFYAHYYLALAVPQCKSFQYAFKLMADTIVLCVNKESLPQFAETYAKAFSAQSNNSSERMKKLHSDPTFETKRLEAWKRTQAEPRYKELLSENTSKRLIGHPVSADTRRKIGDSHKGKSLSEQHRNKLSEAAKVRPARSEESRKKQGKGASERMTARNANPAFKAASSERMKKFNENLRLGIGGTQCQ